MTTFREDRGNPMPNDHSKLVKELMEAVYRQISKTGEINWGGDKDMEMVISAVLQRHAKGETKRLREQKEGKKEEQMETRKSVFESVFDESYIPFGKLFDKNFLGENATVAPATRKPNRAANKKIENAIYSYIRAIRALGRIRINTAEIAEALHLPIQKVNASIAALKRKGVRVASALPSGEGETR